MLLDGSMKETPRRRIPDTSSLNKNPRISWEIRRGRGGGVSVGHVPPSWQEESGPAGCLVCVGRSMPPALTNHSTFWGWSITNVHKATSWATVKQGRHGLELYIVVGPCLLWALLRPPPPPNSTVIFWAGILKNLWGLGTE